MVSSVIRREEAIDQIRRLKLERETLIELLSAAGPGSERQDLEGACDAVSYQLQRELSAYLQALELVNFTRCPFSGKVLSMPVDLAGFGGAWWDYDYPIRSNWTYVHSFCGYTGGANLIKVDEPIDHFCKPGPSHPFVVPEILSMPGVKAVLSSYFVGNTQMFILSHFAEQRPVELPCIGDLGSRHSTLLIDGVAVKREGIAIETLELDFDLEKWIRLGKLLWISEGDNSALLRSDVMLCPYLNMPGEKCIARVNRGVLSRSPLQTNRSE